MIVRSTLRCSATRRLSLYQPKSLRVSRRSYSSSPNAYNAVDGFSQTSMLAAFTSELDKIGPKFEIQGCNIQILQTPPEFYETLKAKILSAEERIFLSTLYIGKTENELISTLRQALRAKPKLKLSILTDALRGTREAPGPSCASLLVPLVAEFGSDRVEIRMYHTPNLTGLRKKYIPKRINEGWGLQHMKIYGADDEVIISGANLSNDYFTNRQDRYHVFSVKEIAQYFYDVHSSVCKLSFLATPDPQIPAGFRIEWPSSNLAPSPLDDPQRFISATTTILNGLLKAGTTSRALSNISNPKSIPDTTVYPISQLTPLLEPDTSTELPAIRSILATLASPDFKNSSWTFTAGYFNPDPSLSRALLSTTSRNNIIITASPQANGFYGSAGVSGLLPAAYTLLVRRFLASARQTRSSDDVTLKEWQRGTVGAPDGWTYHAKGLWVSLAGEGPPSLSVVGSSNYTKRSYGLDLEVGAIILTRDDDLKRRLAAERDALQDWASVTTPDDFNRSDRRVGLHVRIAMWIVGLVGGAL